MDAVATFEKVGFEEFHRAMEPLLPKSWSDGMIRQAWEQLEVPTRSTAGSAGYDFRAPIGFTVDRNVPIVIPTGIRAKIKEGWMLMCVPRSGLGFNHGFELYNTVGIIDSDYYYSDNEGHIMLKVSAKSFVEVERGHKFAQGIFVPYGVTKDDAAKGTRNGGFGSTDGV